MEYAIDYHTGAASKKVKTDDLEVVKKAADTDVQFTGQDITIFDELGNEVCHRKWWGHEDGWKGNSKPIRLGNSGFYSDWEGKGK